MNIRGVAVRILFLAIIEQEICHAFKFFSVFIYNFLGMTLNCIHIFIVTGSFLS